MDAPKGHESGRTTLHVVAHTHWDREWYEPFQSFRLKLVDTLDELLDILDDEAGFRFLLDGQTAMVDDYLAVRPEREADIRRHAADGRLTLGPLTALPDELLVSGETLVRNVQRGLQRAAELGEPMPIGYLPDMFGHTAQMPQILVLAGLDRAAVWRGVPHRVDRTLFRWRALDGSEVLTTYLSASYSNAVALPLEAAALASRAHALVDEQAQFSPPGHVLAMCGTDHWPPQRGLAAAFAALPLDGVEVRLSSIADYFDAVAAVDTAPLPVVEGEMRSGSRANVLMGVTSTRVDLKGLQARAERTLERCAEPLCAVSGTTAPDALFDQAWSHLVLNSAHDSVCSCSSDETMAAVEHRYLEAGEIAEGLAHRGMRDLCDRIHDDRLAAGEHSLVVWNPSPFPRSEVIAVDVPVHWDTTAPEPRPATLEAPDGSVHPGVPLEWQSEVMLDVTLTGDQIMGYLPLLRTREFGDVFVNQVDFEVSDELVEIWLRAEPKMRGHLDAEALKSSVVGLVEENPGRSFHVQLVRLPTQRILVRTPPVPPLGWTTLRAVPGTAEPGGHGAGVTWSADGDEPTLSDGTSTVAFGRDGTFTLTDAAGLSVGGLGRIADGGDAGDTYNWSPPSVDSVVDSPVAVTIAAVEATSGSLPRRSVRVERRYLLPAALATGDTSRSDDHVALDVTTTVTLTAGDPLVEVVVEFDNTVRDHRLRMHLPLPAPVTASTAGAAFGAVTRGLEAEGGQQELPLATYPAHRFVDCTGPGGGLTVACEQVVEYEVCDGAELALTLVRATGYLSRSAPALRPNAAGPVLAVRHAQSLGPQRLRLGLRIHDGASGPASEAVQLADRFVHPLRTRLVRANPGGGLPKEGAPLELSTSTAVALTAFGRDPFTDRMRLRLVNLSDETGEVTAVPQPWFAAASGIEGDARLVDLRGQATGTALNGIATLDPWRIATFEWRTASR